jgi:hypothetical protein
MRTRGDELSVAVPRPYLDQADRAVEALGTKMHDFEKLAVCEDVIENIDSYRFVGQSVRKCKSLKYNRLFDQKGRGTPKKRGPQEMQVYLTMFMKTKGKKNGLRVCLTMFMKTIDLCDSV